MWRLAAALALTAVALAGETTAGQTPAPSTASPPTAVRDTQTQKPGTSVIRGRVVTDSSGSPVPIRAARVSVGPGMPLEPVFTDDAGRFELSALPAGRYTLTAEKTGFVKTRFGSKSDLDPPVPIDVPDGSAVGGIEMRMAKGAAIVGRVVDELGDPVVAAPISVGLVQIVGTTPRFVPIARPASDTNELGEYRIGGLPAGRYYLSVAGATEGATVFGAPTEWARTMNWGRTFYQSGSGLGSATAIILAAGEERTGVDLALSPVRPARLLVTLTDAGGAPAEGLVNLVMIDESLNEPVRNMALPFPRPNPGQSPVQRTVNLDPGNWIGVALVGSSQTVTRFTLLSGEQSTINFSPVTGAHITGRVVFPESSPPGSGGPLRVTTRFAGPEAGAAAMSRVTVPVAADGTFELREVHGTIELQLMSVPQGWTVQSVMYENTDLLDTPLVLKGGEEIRDVQISLANRLGRLSGTTQTADGRPSPGCAIALVPDGPMSVRRSRFLRADQNGRFTLEDLLPGAYVVAAPAGIDPARWLTPDSLSSLRAIGSRVVVSGNDQQTLALRCAEAP